MYKRGDILVYTDKDSGANFLLEVKDWNFMRCNGDFLPRVHYDGKTKLLAEDQRTKKLSPCGIGTYVINVRSSDLRIPNSEEIDLSSLLN